MLLYIFSINLGLQVNNWLAIFLLGMRLFFANQGGKIQQGNYIQARRDGT
jgi:hypothetical protein